MTRWFVYIVSCVDSTLYTGVTTDVKRRLHEHNHDDKLAAAYTRGRRPVKLMYQETHVNRSGAARREAEIKRMPRKEKEILMKSTRQKKGKKR